MPDNTSDTKPKRKNILPLIALTAMLIIAPFGSWLYLKLGIDYRMTALEQLTPKEVPANVTSSLASLMTSTGKAKLIHINDLDSEVAGDLFAKLEERIVDKTYFEMISLADKGTGNSSISYHPEISEIPFEDNLLLYDSSNALRASYKLSDDIGKDVIRHLAVVIPIPKQKNEVKLKRDIEENQ